MEQPLERIAPASVVLGVPVWGIDLEGFLDAAFARIAARTGTLFSTANAHSIVQAQRDPRLRTHFCEADAVLPDGMLAAWGARILGGHVHGRVAGPDFFEAFLARAELESVSVFLLGSTERTLAALRSRCAERYPGLVVKGTLAPPFGEFDGATDQALVNAVNVARPDALFVAMTAPKQELWLSRNMHRLEVPFAMGVGAAFDFLAGTRRRAPPILGRIGAEWLFRLTLEPARLWRRNLDSLVFLALIARDLARHDR
jgi:N-acetylglucosaminyldiphosphoundecaprenol N-acetyl-beta-D-mannosaminyltransferase